MFSSLKNDCCWVAWIWPDDKHALSCLDGAFQLVANDVVQEVEEVVAVCHDADQALRVFSQNVLFESKETCTAQQRD